MFRNKSKQLGFDPPGFNQGLSIHGASSVPQQAEFKGVQSHHGYVSNSKNLSKVS